MKIGRWPAAWTLLTSLLGGAAMAQDQPPAVEPAPESTEQQPETLPTVPVPQKEEPPPPPIKESEGATKLESVVVTSTKFKENAREVAGGITVLRGEILADKNYQDAEDFLKLVPGVNLTGGGDPYDPKKITVRGISNISGTTMTSGTFWGDVPFSDPYIARVTLDPNTFDLETVEVLKGPQGTLFGATALNGAVRYVPKGPEFGHWGMSVFGQGDTVRYGSPGWTFGGALNAPIAGDNAALRVVGFGRKEGGYIDETGRGEKDVNWFRQYGYRGLFAWRLAEKWQIDLQHTYQYAYSADSSITQGTSGTLERHNTPAPSTTDTHYTISSLGITRKFDWGEWTTTGAWLDKHFDTVRDLSRNLSPGEIPGQNPRYVQGHGPNYSFGYTAETRLVYDPGDSNWRWIAGLFANRMAMWEANETQTALSSDTGIHIPGNLLHDLPLFPVFITSSGELNLGSTTIDVAAKEWAAFGELRRKFFDKFEAAFSARLFRTWVGGTVTGSGAALATANNGNPEVVATNEIVERKFNPSFSLTWKPTRNFIAYTVLSRGFRTGGLNPLSQDMTVNAPPTYKSDTIDNFEVGERSTWFSGTLTADLGLYYLKWKEPQLFQAPEMGFSQYIDNVGGATGKGIELALAYIPPFLGGLRLSGAASWSKTNTSEEFADVSGQSIEPGTQWPFAPIFQSTESLDYPLVLGSYELKAGLTHTFIGRAYTDLTHADAVFHFHTLDFNAGFRKFGNSAFPQIAFTVNNLLDSRGRVGLESLGGPLVPGLPPEADPVNGSTAYSATYIRPRSMSLRLTFEF